MPDSRLRAWVALTALALVVVVALGSVRGSQAVAADLRQTAQQRLAAAGLDGVDVELRGRDAELSGGSAADRDEARAVVAAIGGVRTTRVLDGSDAGPPVPSPAVTTTPTLSLVRTDRGASISGVVPSADEQVRLRAAVAAVFGPARGDLVVDPRVRGDAWLDDLPAALGPLAAVDGLRLRVGAGTLTVAGSVAGVLVRDDVLAAVTGAAPDLRVVDRLVVEP